MYIQNVEFRLKGMEREISFTHPKVLIYGPNGSGKTAILQAIQLALSKEVSDFGGRASAKAGYMLEQLGDDPYSEVTFSNGAVAKWTPKQWVGPNFSILNPMAEVESALTGSKETVVKLFFDYFVSEEEDLNRAMLTRLDMDKEYARYLTLATGTTTKARISQVLVLARSMGKAASDEARELSKVMVLLEKHSIYADASTLYALEGIARAKAAKAKEVEALVGLIMEDAVKKGQKYIEHAVTSYLIGNNSGNTLLRFGFRFDGIKAYLGLKRGNTVLPAVSGAEWVQLTAAMAAAIIAQRPSEYNLIIAGDRALDLERLTTLQEALNVDNANIFMQTPYPSDIAPGWCYVDADDADDGVL